MTTSAAVGGGRACARAVLMALVTMACAEAGAQQTMQKAGHAAVPILIALGARSGITDIRLEGGIEARAAANVAKSDSASSSSSAKAGVSSSWSWNAGTSTAASGGFNSKVF